ncbi:MAG TPA: type IV secretory system conjugative DNA transfer family protein [Flavobacteriaceae bacterium]|nr:type IV secretory system conjugative DNA transfer family protein [Bacteroidota bacterium]HPF11194.1 type IV secretory system conjugative DNA transfer family protein [Flavobacteriaceae bacterium]HQU22418.1 type IV secretory system conjugative DNA transfer family protein [Flavobacteriaceae bacterium]HQU66331.1 type IV secretory system conjugative DNA transfer family protein [Flavobacteriaceae bacterium]HRW43687.1 type IV secretory system conjugative DNA transfer family protein [Flavobacteriace
MNTFWPHIILFFVIPLLVLLVIVIVFYVDDSRPSVTKKYRIHFKLKNGKFRIENLLRGISIIGSAGSGKTESVVYNLLQHFSEYGFCGIIHDYKDFELTEMAYPLFKRKNSKFYTISFDVIYFRVNPIAPKYLPNEESVNEVSKVLLDNLLEQNLSDTTGSSKFFNDAVEGLLSGLIWKMKTSFPQYCTLPHIIALYQTINTKNLIAFLSSDFTSRAMSSAFLNGVDSEKQTAGVKSTLANAFKKISSKKMFMVLSADEVPLNINHTETKSVISVINNPQFETVYSPIIATIIHVIVKQMSVRGRESSFLLMEEAPTIKLNHMHRIPATLRSYDISTVYVMQDKVQNDLLYGEKASKAILSNLSYQFFGKVNDPDTAKYYEHFFEIVKAPTKSISKNSGLSWESRITKGEKEVSKRRADLFFRLKQGEFIAFADGKDKKLKFELQRIEKVRPKQESSFSEKDLQLNFQKVFREVASIGHFFQE